jgi:hypothetical protein
MLSYLTFSDGRVKKKILQSGIYSSGPDGNQPGKSCHAITEHNLENA